MSSSVEIIVLETSAPARSSPDGVAGEYVERRSATQLNYNEFYWNYMQRNWPVILTDVSNEWDCRLNWLVNLREHNYNGGNGDGQDTVVQTATNICLTSTDSEHNVTADINFDYLRKRVANCRVPIADCSREYFNSHAKTEMMFHSFLDHWQSRIKTNATTNSSGSQTTDNLYLKDWHLREQMPNYDFYQVPKHFASDWLNEYLITTQQEDYRFVYMGPKDSWTPFHADVFGSYSWSANITGCKKWLLLPPGEELKLLDQHSNLPFCIDEALLKQKNIRFFKIFQVENEAIFVPSGWYHQVWNLTDTISVNHNWFNSCNVAYIWHSLAKNMQQVISEIEDCRKMDDFDNHCQIMLRATFGINYIDFLDILQFITKRRVSALNSSSSNNNNNNNNDDDNNTSAKCLIFEKYTFNDRHIRADLKSIRRLLSSMVEDPVVSKNHPPLYQLCLELLELIKTL